MQTIIDNGIESAITDEQAKDLLAAGAIYGPCDEHGGAYHVAPDTELEQAYKDATGPFSFLDDTDAWLSDPTLRAVDPLCRKVERG